MKGASHAPRMRRLVQSISSLFGWRGLAAAFTAGALSVLAMAPFHLWPVLFATFPVLVWLLDGCLAGATARGFRAHLVSAALTGWAFGFGYFVAGLYWIGSAFLVEADIFAWLLPVAVTGLPAFLALYFGLAAAVAAPLWRPGPARLVALAAALTATEWLRGQLLTGFPWNTPGYALAASEAMMQWASVFGVFGLTLIAVLVFTAPAAVWEPRRAPLSPLRRYAYPVLMGAVLIAAAGWGHWRLQGADTRFVEDVRLRIVQPSIPQKEKWKPENRGPVFQRYLTVSRQGAPRQQISGVTHLIWPESALPFLLTETQEALDAIAAMLPEGTVFITGQARAEGRGSERDIYNSLLVMDGEANLLGHYDKVHLVPFGEYLPYQGALEAVGLRQLTRLRGGFAEGRGTRMTRAPGLPPFVALICYEIIFPFAIREKGGKPEWMLNVTNDAWFGDGTGPYQHFHQARVRAVEQGLPLVRAANNGITAVVDAHGRIVARVPRHAVQALDAALPRPLPGTVFAEWGRLILAAMLLLSLAAWRALAGRSPR